MEVAARLARVGNSILGVIAGILILLMLIYGGYSLWDTSVMFQNSFVSEDIIIYKPTKNVDNVEDASNKSLEDMQTIYPDVRGWITIDDTFIDYPVVQGEDDMEYVNKSVDGEFSISGAIFLSCLNAMDFSDLYNLIYGHNMDNDSMFGNVINFMDRTYFEEHKFGTLYIPDKTYKISVFACVVTNAYDEIIYNPDKLKNGDIEMLLDYIRSKSVQFRDIGVASKDQIVGLSTCSDTETNGRVILFGRLEDE